MTDLPSPPTDGDGHADETFWSGLVASVKRPIDRLLGRRTFAGEAESGAAQAGPKRKVRVLFVDVGNSSRSQVGQAFATIYGFHAESAGTFPAMHVAPEAVAAMSEIGLDLAGFRPKPLDTSRLEAFDRIVTFGDPLPGPYRNRPNVEEWNVLDPQGLSVTGYATMRDDMEKRVRALARRFKVKQPDLVVLQG
ncbi:MAG: low molecular weight phosphatase family protein [Thermoplasmatota archaeon]